jgi:hypothetical protein
MADKKTEKNYSAKDFAKKMGGVTKKFDKGVATMDSAVFAPLPKGTYTVEVHPAVFKETSTGGLMIRIPFTVDEGSLKGRRDSVTIFFDENQLIKSGPNEGKPRGLIDAVRNAKNLGVDTNTMKGFDEVLTGLEEVTALEGLRATVIVDAYEYVVKKAGPTKGKTKTGTSSVFAGLVDAGEESSEDAEEEATDEEEEVAEEEETEEEEASEEEEATPAFAKGDKVKMKKGRVSLSGVILKAGNQDDEGNFTYSVKTDKDKKVHQNVPESDLESL